MAHKGEGLFHGDLGSNPYRFNGKEFSEEMGLYDYGARWYDPAVARWTSVDPLAGKYAPYSPYNYVLGNPISNTDPDGRSVNNEYVTDSKSGRTVLVGTAGGDDVDFVYSGTVNDDGSVSIDNTDPEVLEVEHTTTINYMYQRGPGHSIVGTNQSLQYMDGGDDPIFNIITFGMGSRLNSLTKIEDLATLGAKAGRAVRPRVPDNQDWKNTVTGKYQPPGSWYSKSLDDAGGYVKMLRKKVDEIFGRTNASGPLCS